MQSAPLLVVVFWTCVSILLYAYVGYPLSILGLAHLLGRRSPARTCESSELPSVSLLIIAHNERMTIDQRLRNVLALEYPRLKIEIILISDGSNDGTAEWAGAHGSSRVRVIELPERRGKAAAITTGCRAATGEIIVLGDCRQTWASDALLRLVENFADHSVGAVGGELIVQSATGTMSGVGLYWRFEKWLRRLESRVHSTVGLSGSICAVRRELLRPIPDGVVLDDVYWPMRVVMSGYRVVHEERARACDRLPERRRQEFRRKVRTLAGNFQLIAHLPTALLPWRNPICLQFISHKLLRLLAPWTLVGIAATSALLDGPIYRMVLASQTAFYAIALAGMSERIARRSRFSAAAASFVLLNTAAAVAFWVWLSGRATGSWTKVSYSCDASRRERMAA